jgi:glycosyltransferase involved in cell wall biosynthesis
VVLLAGLPMVRDSWAHRLTYGHFVDALVTPTEWLRARMQRYPFVRRLPCAVLPDGVDEARFPPLAGLAAARREARARAGVPAGRAVFLSVGHLVPRKNLTWLPPLLARLPRGADWRWWVAGDGPQEAALRSAVGALGLAAKVEFLGPRDDVPRLMLCADALVMPSRLEQLPLAALEARRAGVPFTLVAAVGAVEEMRALDIRALPEGEAGAWLDALSRAAAAPGQVLPPAVWERGAHASAASRLAFLEGLAGGPAERAAGPAGAPPAAPAAGEARR